VRRTRSREVARARPLHFGGGTKEQRHEDHHPLDCPRLDVRVRLQQEVRQRRENCQDVYDHTLSLMPSELKSKVEGDKDKAIAKCEKMSIESRQCALDASDLEGLMKCPRK
jgi:hypothetical protein